LNARGKAFDSAYHIVGLKANIQTECHSPHTLLALAEAGHGVAIIPSFVRFNRCTLKCFANHIPSQTDSGGALYFLGQAAYDSTLCAGFLHNDRRPHARGTADRKVGSTQRARRTDEDTEAHATKEDCGHWSDVRTHLRQTNVS